MKSDFSLNRRNLHYQSGVITTFTGVLILVLLTMMMFFAVRVGVFEHRVSANEMRQKNAFHAAESGIQQAKEYFRPNTYVLSSYQPDVLGDGTDGWLATGSVRWLSCDTAGLNLLEDSGSHPCFAEPVPGRRASMYYWSYNGSTNLPVNTGALLTSPTETVEVQALLCQLLVDEEAETPVQGCSTNENEADGTRYIVTLLARGQSDCDNGANCTAEALIREQVSNFGGSAGGQAPAVPLTTKNMFPPSGAAEVVANPNGGGVGVPISVWMNRNPSCTPDGSAIDPSQGSWATCEAHEWYELESIPDDVQCPGSCSCAFQESLSYTL
jgi:hypothetical protein